MGVVFFFLRHMGHCVNITLFNYIFKSKKRSRRARKASFIICAARISLDQFLNCGGGGRGALNARAHSAVSSLFMFYVRRIVRETMRENGLLMMPTTTTTTTFPIISTELNQHFSFVFYYYYYY